MTDLSSTPSALNRVLTSVTPKSSSSIVLPDQFPCFYLLMGHALALADQLLTTFTLATVVKGAALAAAD